MEKKLSVRAAAVAVVTLTFCFGSLSANSAQDFAAHITKLDGKAFASRSGGSMRILRVNDRLFEQERVITGRKTSLDLKFTDGTALALGSSTIVTVDSYAYRAKSAAAQADKSEETFSMSILQGAVRAVTGLLAKRRPFSVRFKTKVATIGIRGTHFAAEVDGDSATIILLAQKDPSASNAIEVSNEFGKVDIDEAGFGTEIPDAMSPPSPPRKMNPTHNMSRTLRGLQTMGRVRIPSVPRGMR